MISRIQHIKSFGIFGNFQWPSNIPEFKQYNLIYGWNYSGKTTLSRAFRCFEKNVPHIDFADAKVQIKSEDGTIHDLSIPSKIPVFRVFNTDFVRENLSFAAGSAEPILVLGAEDIAKQDELKLRKNDHKEIIIKRDTDTIKKDEKLKEIEKTLTKYARDFIKNPLAEVNYDKRRFEPKVEECKDTYEQSLLEDTEVSKYIAVYRSMEKKPALSPKVYSLASLSVFQNKAELLLARVVTSNNPIPRLKEDPVIEKWVNQGRSLHDGKDICQFCGQQLPLDLIAHLTGHFSADYENLMAELGRLIKDIQKAQGEEIRLDHKADFYAELSERFIQEKSKLDNALKDRMRMLDRLMTAVTKKQTNAFAELACPKIEDPTSLIADAVKAINNIISEHNSRTADFDKKRGEAFAKLEKHYAAQFVREEKYNEQLEEIKALENSISDQTRTIGRLEIEIRKLEESISEAAKGAERVNDLLSAYFGKNEIRITVTDDKLFKIIREGVVAKNLSEGEKTAIAFAYFITRVKDGRHPLSDTRVVIDDPISSLDANHLFNTYALIKTQLADCRQLFIATHSYEFFNLIRDWATEDEGSNKYANWKKWSIYLVKRMDNGNAILEEIPKELIKFKSEYHFLFSTLYHFYNTDKDDFDRLLSLPNIVRRFMEAFGGIMIPVATGLKGKMGRIFPDAVERERVWKFINQFSHNTTIMRSLTIPDTSECKAVVGICLKAVQNWDEDYFKDLEMEVRLT